MHKLFQGARNHISPPVNKPLPEPLVDPDEGKTAIGELIIIPIQGRDLPNRERFGKQDPFILFKLGNVSKRTMTDIRGGQRPRWKDEQVEILMYDSDAKDATSLFVSCLDEDHQRNELIGDCVINLAKVMEKGEHDDWFELSYKGREAGELMLQLTYYSHDLDSPLHKQNRPPNPPVPSGTLAGRRPIHPVNPVVAAVKADAAAAAAAKADSAAARPTTTPATALVPTAKLDSGPIYQPPSIPAAPADGRNSPSGQNQYIGHPAPQMAPNHPFGQQLPTGAGPYGTVNGFQSFSPPQPTYPPQNAQQHRPDLYPPVGYPPHNPGYPPQQTGYPPQLPGYPPQQSGYPPQQSGYPPQQSGYPPQQSGYPPQQSGYPPQQIGYPSQQTGYPPQQMYPPANGGYPPQHNSFSGYPPQMNNSHNGQGYPPQHNTFNGYPPRPNSSNGLYPPAGSHIGPGGLYPLSQSSGYPPAGYPFATTSSSLYPPIQTTAGGRGSFSSSDEPSRPHSSLGISSPSSSPPTQSRPVPPIPTSAAGGYSTLPGSYPGMFPGPSQYLDVHNNQSELSGHKVSVNHGQTTSTFPNGHAPRARSMSPPELPPRNNPSSRPPSYNQALFSPPGR
ncbi:hypothetical protein EMPS_10908 [Entomortierella parvispora]|uniref:C2 domain-containing protein n=1 Tax=Entomortierella parvispora TaxID=205924 RepID=A0A9P3M1M5_9FUNG|nr:hypothetical protein EMPS_10908 [Entomortierella parvispora]